MDRAEIVVVGGGIVGLSVALALCHQDPGTVRVLERGGVGQSTTRAGAGILDLWAATLAGGEEEIALEFHGFQFYSELSNEHDIGFRTVGNVWVAQSAAAWEHKLAALLKHPSIDGAERLTADEAAELVPILQPHGIHAAVHQPGGAHLLTLAAAEALTEEIEIRGGTVRTGTLVTDIEVRDGRVTGVATTSGPVAADAVVVSAGAWTNQLLGRLGLWIPMIPLLATRFITSQAGIAQGMPNVLVPENRDLYVREYNGALSWGCIQNGPPRFDFIESDPPDELDTVGRLGTAEIAATGKELQLTIPSLHELPVVETRTGCPCHTPDYRPVLGPLADIEGLWVAAGDNYAGVTHGPGLGRLLAELMLGKPTFVDGAVFAPGRFTDKVYRTPVDVLNSPLVRSAGWA